ncbi:uncharacterized protein BT62DRAFT_921588 [Guyanagaster necrorhizus]|uniref:Uncharacterized protein n=1 Tax=Guyanagaster necrorhizus TaxID=856835 RepID=A0A9P7VP71_9AGAR|nr:uncharacterized protein BT62DRAFT_921588 [Guyanagaster necrorhizus MCA 3950]KAG7443940.1 hypothetical protein BT62DRAFT_921588 [Guyanagaster necrorhizus MCA 3950]
MANLIGAYAFTAAYFNSSVVNIVEPQDLVIAVNQAAYHVSLMHVDLHDSNYEVEHKNSSWDYDASLLLPEEPGYKDGNPSSIPYRLLLSSYAISPPPAPVVIGPTALVPKVVEPETSSSRVPQLTPIRTPQISREPSFPPVTKNTISMVLPAVCSGSRATVVCKYQQETGILAPTVPAPVSKRAKPIPYIVYIAFSHLQPYSPPLPFPLPLVPLSSVFQTTFQWKPIPGSLEFPVPSALSIDHDTSTPSAVKSNRPAGSSPCSVSTSDPASEGPEGAPMEAVPSALDSLLSPSPHAYHSLTNHLHDCAVARNMSTIVIPIKILILSVLLCFPGHALTALWLVFLRSAFLRVELLCHATTLLDPLILSGDSAIHHGIDHIKCIKVKIKLLMRSLQLLYEDWQQVVGKLTDGLDAIASCEHDIEIIKAYAQVSDLLKSFLMFFFIYSSTQGL